MKMTKKISQYLDDVVVGSEGERVSVDGVGHIRQVTDWVTVHLLLIQVLFAIYVFQYYLFTG